MYHQLWHSMRNGVQRTTETTFQMIQIKSNQTRFHDIWRLSATAHKHNNDAWKTRCKLQSQHNVNSSSLMLVECSLIARLLRNNGNEHSLKFVEHKIESNPCGCFWVTIHSHSFQHNRLTFKVMVVTSSILSHALHLSSDMSNRTRASILSVLVSMQERSRSYSHSQASSSRISQGCC